MNDRTPANPNGEPSLSFRQRAAARISAERPEPQAEMPPANPPADPQMELDIESTEAEIDEGAIEDAEGEYPAGDEDADEDPTSAIERWRRQAEEADEARQSMERDYRRKTHKIAQTVEELRERVVEARATHEVLLTEAQAEMMPFQNINWNALQQDPVQYQQASAAWREAQTKYQRRIAEAERLIQRTREMRDEARKSQAEISKDILRSQVPGWSGEKYQEIKQFAVDQYDYTPEEVDEQVDWRWIKVMDDARRVIKRPGVKGVTAVGKPPASGKNRPVAQARNAQGKYQTARAHAFENPGNRGALRSALEAKLKAERNRGQ